MTCGLGSRLGGGGDGAKGKGRADEEDKDLEAPKRPHEYIQRACIV